MKYYLHILDLTLANANNEVLIYDSEESETIQDLQFKICNKFASLPEQVEVAFDQNAKPLSNFSMLLSSFFANKQMIYVTISKQLVLQIPQDKPKTLVKQVATEEIKIEHFIPITKYTFYEVDDWNVRIIIELKDIGKLPKENFQARWLERSFEFKIRGYNGKNYQFGVGRTIKPINTEKSKFLVKDDKVLLTIRKVKKEDNWFSLVKVKTIGSTVDSD